MDRYFLKLVFVVGLLITAVFFAHFISVDKIEEKTIRLTDRKVDPEFLFAPSTWVDSVLDSLTLEERIAQLIMVAAYSKDNLRNETEVTKLVRDFKIGGLVFFQGTPHRQAMLTNYYQSLAATPLMIAMDAECGLAMRLDSTVRYPSQMTLGLLKTTALFLIWVVRLHVS